MRRALRVTPALMRVSFARLFAYRAEMTIWILSASLPLVMLALWNAVAKDGPVAGFGQVELARYFAAALVVRQLTGAWIAWNLNFEIRTGALSPKLLRPLHPLWHDAVWMFTALPIRLVVLLPLLVALLLWRPELWLTPDPLALALFGVSVVLAWTLSFLVQAAFGVLSFWVDQSMGLFGVWYAFWALLSGYVAPLSLFPEAWQGGIRWLPFRAMLATPIEILGGFVEPAAALPDVAAQVAWTGVALALVAWLWRRGVRRYGAFGA